MITGEIKNRIDGIWDVFYSAGVTSPLTVLEQMTYLFFIKLLDDGQLNKEATASLFNTVVPDPVFKQGNWVNPETGAEIPFESMRWHKFRNFDAQRMFDTLRNDVFVFIRNIHNEVDGSYSRFMKNTIFMVPNALTLTRIVDEIDGLNLHDKDSMGDVYEYILGKMAASGTNGQFRTPRHIIRMMVAMMQPTLHDTVCDPAMGSAGFIVESARYVSEQYAAELLNTEHADNYANRMFYGFDTDQTMLRIGAMNMMLHGVQNPNIEWQDSLSNENTDSNRYSLILANPPFTGSLDQESVDKSLLAITKTKKTELLFLSLFLRILRPGGRCASIVPDGVLFGSSKAHQAIRKELIEKHKLEAVISMPSGVFKPYAGVSTAILVFTKTNSGGTDRVWFYDMKADGYSLDDKRNALPDSHDNNNIPDIIARFTNREAEGERSRKEQSFFVDKADIVANDYDLSINKYKEVERVKVDFEDPKVIFARIKVLQNEIDGLLNDFEKGMEG